MKLPIISVIVPVYNVAALLPRCIDSLLNQKFTDYEVLLVDDGSTDGSGEICDKYGRQDTRIKVIHKQNEGVSKTRNRGMDEACGEWITFVDADDYVASGYLSDLYSCVDPGIELVIHSLKHMRESGESLYDYDLPEGARVYAKSDFAVMVKEQHVSRRGYAVGKLFKKQVLDEQSIRFDPGIEFNEDWILVFSYLNVINGCVCCAPVSNYLYVDREGSLSHAEHDFTYNYGTFVLIKNMALAFCSTHGADIVDLDPLYLMHKALTLAVSTAQLRSIKAGDWDFFNRYYRATSMKTACDKWMVRHFCSCLPILSAYFNLSRKFRKMLERYNLWSIVNLLRK